MTRSFPRRCYSGTALFCYWLVAGGGVLGSDHGNNNNNTRFEFSSASLQQRQLFRDTSTRKSAPFGGGGGSPFDHVATLGGPDNIVKIVRILMRIGRRMDRLEVTYLLRNGQTQTLVHGGGGGHVRGPFDFTTSQEALRDIDLRSGGRIDQVKLIQTNDVSYGPFGGGGGSPGNLQSQDGEVIIGFYGRAGGEIDQLGVYFKKNAILSIQINGPFNYSLVRQDVTNGLEFQNTASSRAVLDNCRGVSPLFGSIAFTEGISQSDLYTQSSTEQKDISISTTRTVDYGSHILSVSSSTTIAVGNSFSETTAFGEEHVQEHQFAFDTSFQANPGQVVVAEATFSQVSFALQYAVAVLVFYASNPQEAVPDILEGEYHGTRAFNARVQTDHRPCPGLPPPPPSALPSGQPSLAPSDSPSLSPSTQPSMSPTSSPNTPAIEPENSSSNMEGRNGTLAGLTQSQNASERSSSPGMMAGLILACIVAFSFAAFFCYRHCWRTGSKASLPQ